MPYAVVCGTDWVTTTAVTPPPTSRAGIAQNRFRRLSIRWKLGLASYLAFSAFLHSLPLPVSTAMTSSRNVYVPGRSAESFGVEEIRKGARMPRDERMEMRRSSPPMKRTKEAAGMAHKRMMGWWGAAPTMSSSFAVVSIANQGRRGLGRRTMVMK